MRAFTPVVVGLGVVAVVVSTIGAASAEPPFDGLPWIWPNVITSADPSSLETVTYEGRGRRVFYEHWRWEEISVHLFRARYPGTEIEVQVHPEWRRRRGRTAQNAWQPGYPPYDSPAYDERIERERMHAEVEFIANVVGRLPALYRARIRVASLDGIWLPGDLPMNTGRKWA